MRTLGVILARGGSQGLAGKHLLPLLGKPMIRYTFEHARSARLLTDVVVSSDDEGILQEGRAAGFVAVKRPAELASSTASVQDVLLHAMDAFEAENGRVDAVVTLYGNVPVRAEGCIDRGIEMLSKGGDSVRSFVPVGKWHPGWMAKLGEDGKVEQLRAGSVHRRQDLEPLWLHDGGVVVSTRAIMEVARGRREDPHAFFGVDRRGFEVGQGETIEVDHRRDLYWAEAVLRDRSR